MPLVYGFTAGLSTEAEVPSVTAVPIEPVERIHAIGCGMTVRMALA